jgi:hypothetical protein
VHKQELSGTMRLLVRALEDGAMIDGTAEPAQDERTKDAFAAKHGWAPRNETSDYPYVRIVPDRVQAWRDVNELPARTFDATWASPAGR